MFLDNIQLLAFSTTYWQSGIIQCDIALFHFYWYQVIDGKVKTVSKGRKCGTENELQNCIVIKVPVFSLLTEMIQRQFLYKEMVLE